jgi:short-subunit dehydrogenase
MEKVIITGASKGIGKAMAFEYAKQGADLFLIARNQNELAEICQLLSLINCKSNYYACDISNKQELNKALTKAIEFLSGIDTVILNAAINMPDSFSEYSSDVLKRIFEVNVFSLSYTFEFLIPFMKKQKHLIMFVFIIIIAVLACNVPAAAPAQVNDTSTPEAASPTETFFTRAG